MGKQKSTAAQIAQLETQVQQDIERWNYLKENGCNDPFWPDGVNMNLKRNHIIYGLRQIARLDQSERQLSVFDMPGMVDSDVENDPRVPPKVADDFMVRDGYENGRRIKAG